MAVDSYAATSLATAMNRSLLDFFTHSSEGSPVGGSLVPTRDAKTFIIGLANDIQAILRDATTAMFLHKPFVVPTRGTLPRHLWPETVCHNISNVWRRAKVIRRLT